MPRVDEAEDARDERSRRERRGTDLASVPFIRETTMRLEAWILAGAIALGTAIAGDATAPTAQAPDCGQRAELLAAREAAARGDSKAALEHLHRADELIGRCMREGPAPPPSERDRHATETG